MQYIKSEKLLRSIRYHAKGHMWKKGIGYRQRGFPGHRAKAHTISARKSKIKKSKDGDEEKEHKNEST